APDSVRAAAASALHPAGLDRGRWTVPPLGPRGRRGASGRLPAAVAARSRGEGRRRRARPPGGDRRADHQPAPGVPGPGGDPGPAPPPQRARRTFLLPLRIGRAAPARLPARRADPRPAHRAAPPWGGVRGPADPAVRPAAARRRHPGPAAAGSRRPRRAHLGLRQGQDRKSTRLNSSHVSISYAVFCLIKKTLYSAFFVVQSVVCVCCFALMPPQPPRSPLFPYTTLFRSCTPCCAAVGWSSRTRRPRCSTRRGPSSASWTRSCWKPPPAACPPGSTAGARSEEHTSELQSRFDLVCRLLLDKKNPLFCLLRRAVCRMCLLFCFDAAAATAFSPLSLHDALPILHTVLRRRGVEFEDPQTPLFDPPRPVVGILDPQLLEAAARGVPTWVYGRGMPSWVHEYWQRYGLRHWGGPPSPVPVPSADEPSRLIAQIVDGHE